MLNCNTDLSKMRDCLAKTLVGYGKLSIDNKGVQLVKQCGNVVLV